MTFAAPHIHHKSPLAMSHIATAGNSSGVASGGTWSSTISAATGKTIFALSTNHENSDDVDLTFKVGGVTITPLAEYENTSSDQRGNLAIYEVDTPAGGTVSFDVDVSGHAVRYLKLDSFSATTQIKTQNTYTGSTNASTGASVSADVDDDGYLLMAGTTIHNNGAIASDIFVGVTGLDHYASGVSSQSVGITQGSGSVLGSVTVNGITEVGTRIGNAADWNYSDGSQILVVAVSAK